MHGYHSTIGTTDKAMNRMKVHYFGRACEPDFTTNGLSQHPRVSPKLPPAYTKLPSARLGSLARMGSTAKWVAENLRHSKGWLQTRHTTKS